MTEITRRRLLVAAGAALPAVLVPLKPWRALVEMAPPPTAAVRLAGVLGNRDSARAVGREYLRVAPAAPGELATAISEQLAGAATALDRADDEELRDALAACVRQDFDGDEIVTVGGWVLSRTEARLCALVALAGRDA